MSFTLTFNNIYENQESKVGLRASDLAEVHRANYPLPLGFVITSPVFEDFLTQNKLGISIPKTLSGINWEDEEQLKKACASIKNLFSEAILPEEYEEQIREAYEALNISPKKDAQGLLSDASPTVNIIISPDYALEPESLTGVILNIKGFENFIKAIKSCWSSLYSHEELKRRKKNNINDFNAAIIVQKFHNSEATIEADSKSIIGDYEITLEAYKGLPDISRQATKDMYSLSKEFLRIEKHEAHLQEYCLEKTDNSGLLTKKFLGKAGIERKVTDKQATEAARITKRLSSILKNHFKGFFSVKGEEVKIFLINRKQAPTHQTPKNTQTSEDHLDTEEKADSRFFKDIIDDLEPQIENEIRRRYAISFGSDPENVEQAITEISKKHNFPEKEQIYKLKAIKESLINSEEIDMDYFMNVTEQIRKFLNG